MQCAMEFLMTCQCSIFSYGVSAKIWDDFCGQGPLYDWGGRESRIPHRVHSIYQDSKSVVCFGLLAVYRAICTAHLISVNTSNEVINDVQILKGS